MEETYWLTCFGPPCSSQLVRNFFGLVTWVGNYSCQLVSNYFACVGCGLYETN